MGLFTTNVDEIYDFVKKEFGDTKNYLMVFKHNSVAKSIFKLAIDTLYQNIDSSRNYILYFDERGIHEKELSFSDQSSFVFIPWNEIEEFIKEEKANKVILKVNHLGKFYSYEAPFHGKIMKGNKKRYHILKENNFSRID